MWIIDNKKSNKKSSHCPNWLVKNSEPTFKRIANGMTKRPTAKSQNARLAMILLVKCCFRCRFKTTQTMTKMLPKTAVNGTTDNVKYP
uniref:Uncharacterized protein n=1 Tax=Romanomermis culicivorax TaxID=13658 RepID=A0A915KTN9_ROMCU